MLGCPPPPPARQVGHPCPEPSLPSRRPRREGGGWENGLPCHPPPPQSNFLPALHCVLQVIRAPEHLFWSQSISLLQFCFGCNKSMCVCVGHFWCFCSSYGRHFTRRRPRPWHGIPPQCGGLRRQTGHALRPVARGLGPGGPAARGRPTPQPPTGQPGPLTDCQGSGGPGVQRSKRRYLG